MIRARYMKVRESQNERERLSVLPIRVGEGDVEGILFNTIVPDIRKKTLAEAAQLIIDRLRLILPSASEAVSSAPDWPEQPPPLSWPMADHTEARAAFEHLLTRTASFRFLPVSGASEVGKTHMTNQMLGNALRIPDLACGRFDFKGTTDMDSEVHSFIQELRVPVPPPGQRLNERFIHIHEALKQRAHPTLLVFDTYEAAGEARDWIEKQLLPSLIRARWLRVVIVGQRVPEVVAATLGTVSSPVIKLQPPPPKDWFLFGQQHNPEITLEFVSRAYGYAAGRPAS